MELGLKKLANFLNDFFQKMLTTSNPVTEMNSEKKSVNSL